MTVPTQSGALASLAAETRTSHAPLTCREATAIASRALDSASSAEELEALCAHFKVCGWCEDYARQIHMLRAVAANRDPALDDSGPMSDATRQRILAWLKVQTTHGG